MTPANNNYTFVSTRGCSVPDYFFCPVDNLYNCIEMKTILMTDVVNMFGLVPPRNLPDHSILSGAFVTSFYEFGKNFENVNSNQYKNSDNQQLPKKTKKKTMKNLSKIGEFYFMSKEPFDQVSFTINKLENAIDTKADIDQLWKEVTNIFLSEMASLPDIQTSKFNLESRTGNSLVTNLQC